MGRSTLKCHNKILVEIQVPKVRTEPRSRGTKERVTPIGSTTSTGSFSNDEPPAKQTNLDLSPCLAPYACVSCQQHYSVDGTKTQHPRPDRPTLTSNETFGTQKKPNNKKRSNNTVSKKITPARPSSGGDKERRQGHSHARTSDRRYPRHQPKSVRLCLLSLSLAGFFLSRKKSTAMFTSLRDGCRTREAQHRWNWPGRVALLAWLRLIAPSPTSPEAMDRTRE